LFWIVASRERSIHDIESCSNQVKEEVNKTKDSEFNAHFIPNTLMYILTSGLAG